MSSVSMTATLKLKANINAAEKFIEDLVENQKKTKNASIYEYHKQGDEYHSHYGNQSCCYERVLKSEQRVGTQAIGSFTS